MATGNKISEISQELVNRDVSWFEDELDILVENNFRSASRFRLKPKIAMFEDFLDNVCLIFFLDERDLCGTPHKSRYVK